MDGGDAGEPAVTFDYATGWLFPNCRCDVTVRDATAAAGLLICFGWYLILRTHDSG